MSDQPPSNTVVMPGDDVLRIVAGFELRMHLEEQGAVAVGLAQAYVERLDVTGRSVILHYLDRVREANADWAAMGCREVIN